MPYPHDDSYSFLDHLEELRGRIIKALASFAICVAIGYVLAPWPLDWLTAPILRTYAFYDNTIVQPAPFQIEVAADGVLKLRNRAALGDMKEAAEIEFYEEGQPAPVMTWRGKHLPPLFYSHPMDPFVIRLKASVFLGLLLSMPVLLYQAWAFVAPGLLRDEKRFALPLIVAGTLLFPIGASFAYFFLDVTLRFFTQFITSNTLPLNDARAYLGFVLTMMLAFGVIFELPLVVVLATRAGLVTVPWLAERRKYIFILLLVAAALITPSGDPVTLMALTLPLYVLFEGALIASRFLEKRSKEDSELSAEDPEASAP